MSVPAEAFTPPGILDAVQRIRETVGVLREERTGRLGAAPLDLLAEPGTGEAGAALLVGNFPPLYPERLGDRGFCEAHGVRFPYAVGEMANGISTVRMVAEAARAGCLGFFGAGGLEPSCIEEAVTELGDALGPAGPWGSNLIHSPGDPALEDATVEIYLRHAVRRVSASAYLALTPAVIRYAATGLRAGPDGRVLRSNRLFAKVSRPEVAHRFLAPAPSEMVAALVAAGRLSREEGDLAARVPLAEDLTVEADSGGHTDNRPLGAIFPVIAAVRDELARRHGYARAPRIGAAGGIGTPAAAAAAFALGAAYVMTGSVNQAAVESGLGAAGRQLLAAAGVADVGMAPAADMFELGARVQVLRRGTLFAPRASRLHDLYATHASLEEIPEAERARLEQEIFRAPLAEAWAETARFWAGRDPERLARAERDPKQRLALLFRSYLGRASRWAIDGDAERRSDWQIWCGPAMGAFNDWVRGSFLDDLAARSVGQIARNLLEGACVVARAQQLRAAGVPVPPAAFAFRPRELA